MGTGPTTSAAINQPISETNSRDRTSGIAPWNLLAKLDFAVLVILALPWIILRFDSTWLFGYATSSFGFIDPWVYFGYFFDLTQHLRSFKGAYFTTRLTWTVPGAVAYHFLSPITATYVLHLALFYASTLALYFVLKKTVGSRAALPAVLLMAFHSYFLWSIGWPYIDGAANAYLLVTLAILTVASSASNTRRWLLLAGALAAMAIYCQFFLIVFSPLIFGYYYFARRERGRQRSSSDWKPFALGFAVVTVVFGIFNMAVNGRFLFFINSVGTAAKLVINHNPYNDSTYSWLAAPTWLVLPAITLVGAIVCLARRRSLLSIPNADFLLFWQRYYVLSVAIMIFWQLVGQPVLQLSTYASYLLPGVFLALGSQIGIVMHKLDNRLYALLCVLMAFFGVSPLLLQPDSPAMSVLKTHEILIPLALSVIAVVGIIRTAPPVSLLAVAVLAASLGILNATTSTRTWTHGTLPHDEAAQKYALLALADSIRTVQELDPKANLYFWYNGEDRLGRLYRSVASTYLWAYRLQSETFPELGPKAPPSQRRIAILTEDPSSALYDAQTSLRKGGLNAHQLTTRTIEEGPFRWYMVVIQVTN